MMRLFFLQMLQDSYFIGWFCNITFFCNILTESCKINIWSRLWLAEAGKRSGKRLWLKREASRGFYSSVTQFRQVLSPFGQLL